MPQSLQKRRFISWHPQKVTLFVRVHHPDSSINCIRGWIWSIRQQNGYCLLTFIIRHKDNGTTEKFLTEHIFTNFPICRICVTTCSEMHEFSITWYACCDVTQSTPLYQTASSRCRCNPAIRRVQDLLKTSGHVKYKCSHSIYNWHHTHQLT